MSDLTPLTKHDLAEMRRVVPEYAHIIDQIHLESFLLAYALRRHETLYAVGGFTATDDMGTYIVWLMVTPEGRQHPMALALGARRAFRRALPFIERLEAVVESWRMRDLEFLEAYGFEYEGPDPETYGARYVWDKERAWQRAGH